MQIAPDIEVDDVALAAVCDKYGIAELKVFGSRARGTARPDSDSRGRAAGVWRYQRTSPEMRLTEPATMTTPNR